MGNVLKGMTVKKAAAGIALLFTLFLFVQNAVGNGSLPRISPALILTLAPWFLGAILIAGGYNATKKGSGTGSMILFYAFAVIMIILAVMMTVLGTQLTQAVLGANQVKIQTSVANDIANGGSGISLPRFDLSEPFWQRLALGFLALVFIAGLVKSKHIQAATGIGAAIIMLPFILYLAWGALPEEFRDSAAEINPLVESKAEAQVREARSAAAVADLIKQQRLQEAAEREANQVKLRFCTDTIYVRAEQEGRISDCEVAELRLGGDRLYRDGDPSWQVAAFPPGQVAFVPHDPDGNGIPNGFWVEAIVPNAEVTLYNGIIGKTFQRVTF